MQPFMDVQGLTPRPGRLKCVWAPGADGRLEGRWVPDTERDAEIVLPSETAEPVRTPQPVRKTRPLRIAG